MSIAVIKLKLPNYNLLHRYIYVCLLNKYVYLYWLGICDTITNNYFAYFYVATAQRSEGQLASENVKLFGLVGISGYWQLRQYYERDI